MSARRVPFSERRLVEFGRGRVTVVDRAGLEGAACECYAVTREVYDRMLP